MPSSQWRASGDSVSPPGGLRRPDKRTAWATAASPAPPNEGGDGMNGPPTSRSDVLYGGTAGWPTGCEPSGHGAAVVVRGRESRLQGDNNPQGEGQQASLASRGDGSARCREPGPTAPRELESRMMRKYPVRFGGGPGEKAAMTSLAVYPTSCLAPASSSR